MDPATAQAPTPDDFESISNAIANGNEINEVLELIIERTCELVEIDRAYIFLKEGEQNQALQLKAASDQTALTPPITALPQSLESWVVRRGRSMLQSPQTVNVHKLRSTMLPSSEDANRVTQVAVPIGSGSAAIGVLVVMDGLETSSDPQSSQNLATLTPNQLQSPKINFSVTQIVPFLSVLADLIALALENRQIMKRQNRRSQLIALLQFISQTSANQNTSLEEMSHAIADQIALACNAEKVDIMLYSQETDELVTLGTTNTALSQLQVQLGLDHLPLATAGLLSEVYLTGRPFLSGQVVQSDQVGHLEKLGIKSYLIVPLQVEQQKHGVISLASTQPQAFNEDDLSFINFVSLRLGYSLSHEELTQELAQAENVRIEADERENFIAIIAHDLKNALTVVRGNSQLNLNKIARGDFSFTERTQQLSLVKISQALVLIEDMVEINQIDKGSFRLFRSETELVSLIQEEVEAAQTLHPNANITLKSDYKEVNLNADPTRLRQVISNLLMNALRYSPPESPLEVQITLAPSQDKIEAKARPRLGKAQQTHLTKVAEGLQVMVTIVDKGIGISQADQGHIFERFYRGRGSQIVSGSGLGLYISREIVLQHGGLIWVESEQGDGSTFHLTLPVNQIH